MLTKRVKVRVEHKKKLFFQKYLEVCREASDDRNQQCTMYKAISGLRTFPLEVDSINDLKQINGIGETIATRCYAAWEQICTEREREISLADIKQLSQDDYLALIGCTKNAKKKPSSPKKKNKNQTGDEFDEPVKRKNVAKGGANKYQNLMSTVQDEFMGEDERDENCPSTSNVDSKMTKTNSVELDSDADWAEDRYITTRPHEDAQVILVCDTREHRQKKFNVVEMLINNAAVRFETRVLSVGDFLWVARKIDGTEVVLDWVVERKTWADLDSSIRKGRYDEQKQRLNQAPMANRVYLLEDCGRGSVGAEQALATTRTRDGFHIQRCKNGKETAAFLESVTRRLIDRVKKQTITGISFKHLQKLSEKGQVATVKNVWVEQMTVCPGMSSSRAQTVADSFPTFASLVDYYQASREPNPEDLLARAVPQLPKPISTKMSRFFAP